MLTTSNFEDDKMKMKVIKGIALTLFLVSALTVAFDLFPVSGQEFLWGYPTGSLGIRDVMVSTDGSLVAVGTADGRIFGMGKSGSPLWVSDPGLGGILGADMPDDGRYIVAASVDGFYVLDGATGDLMWNKAGILPSAVDVTSGGEYFAVIHTDNTVSLLTEAGDSVWNATFSGSYADGVSVSDDGRYVVVAGTTDNTVWYFDESGDYLWIYYSYDTVWRVHTSGDGDFVTFGSKDRRVYFFSKTGMLWNFETVNQVNPVTISKDEGYVAAGTGDYTLNGTGAYYIYLFDRTGDYLWRYQTDGTIWDVAISPDNRYVVAASQDNNIYFLDIEGALIGRSNIGSPVLSVSISSDGNYVAAASDSEVFLFNAPPVQAQLNLEVVGSGTSNPTPGSHMYDLGTVVNVDALPEVGWSLDYWLLDGVDVGAEDPIPITMDTIHVLRAVFVEVPPPEEPPVASFTFSPGSPVVDETVSFDAGNSYDPDGTITSYFWDFGDDSSGTGKTTTHAYGAAGTYPVTLTVTDNDGLTNTTLQSISIGKVPSSISISVSETTFTVGESTTISGFLSPPCEGASITIQCRPSGGTWTTLEKVTTGSDGGYRCTWTPTTAATYEVRASWEGDEATLSSKSTGQIVRAAAIELWVPLAFGGVITGVACVAGLLFYLKTARLLPRALSNLEEIITKLGEKTYEDIVKDFDSTDKLIKKAISKGKLPSEISEEPYFINQNLNKIKQTLFDSCGKGTIDSLLKVSEIIPYIEGIICILKAFKNKEWKEMPHEEESSARDCVAYISSNPLARAFEKIHCEIKKKKKDFWFIWPEEYEPIKLVFEKGKVTSVLYRYHWKHFTVDKPCLDEKNRIEVFFLPHFHTPIIRRFKEDVLFAIFVKCYAAHVKDHKVVHDEVIPEYYVSEGEKYRHPPSVDYEGWPD